MTGFSRFFSAGIDSFFLKFLHKYVTIMYSGKIIFISNKLVILIITEVKNVFCSNL